MSLLAAIFLYGVCLTITGANFSEVFAPLVSWEDDKSEKKSATETMSPVWKRFRSPFVLQEGSIFQIMIIKKGNNNFGYYLFVEFIIFLRFFCNQLSLFLMKC